MSIMNIELPTNYEFLQKVPWFVDLPDEDLRSLCAAVTEELLAEGAFLFKEGNAGETAYVIKSGELEILKESSGRDVLLAVRSSGEVIGDTALLEESPRTASVRARSDVELLAINKEDFDNLLRTSISAVNAMFRTSIERNRGTEAMLRQSEKMAQLGTLTAGVAHELNNPAAAVKRGSDQMQTAFQEHGDAQSRVSSLSLSDPQREALTSLTLRVLEQATKPSTMDAMARSDREFELEEWLEDHDVEDPWDLAPALVDLNPSDDDLEELADRFSEKQLASVMQLLTTTYSVHNVLNEIGQGAGRISDIVKALKSYSYLDQAPIQSVDVHEGLDNTLLILRSKVQDISIVRDYDENLPEIQAYGSELNQVWTNMIDNASDALDGKGQITLRTRREGDNIIVEIEDNGTGIPVDVQPRVFDSFFTTKEPGKGTGLGLDISYNIVVQKHRGDIKLSSEPGRTTFKVILPLNFEAKS
jgi:signal transduction histidine kinase